MPHLLLLGTDDAVRPRVVVPQLDGISEGVQIFASASVQGILMVMSPPVTQRQTGSPLAGYSHNPVSQFQAHTVASSADTDMSECFDDAVRLVCLLSGSEQFQGNR